MMRRMKRISYPDYLPREIDDVLRRDHRIFLPREVMEPGDPRWS